MNETSPTPPNRTRNLIVICTSIGVVMALSVGTGAFFLLRALKRGTGSVTRTAAQPNDTPGFNARDKEHYITTYFRRTFLATTIAGYSHLLMRVKRDDGAVVYLNGREAARFNMNTGEVNFLTLARNAGDDGRMFIEAMVPATFLTEGTNVVAVEIHQATADSTDISFEMDLVGLPARR